METQEADEYVKKLQLAGFDEWHLPTRDPEEKGEGGEVLRHEHLRKRYLKVEVCPLPASFLFVVNITVPFFS
jgi:hypothetical protein